MSDTGLARDIRDGIARLAEKNGIREVRLFGSRARGDHHSRSDIDLAVTGGDVAKFAVAVDEEINTLLMFDVVDLDGPVQPELLESIEKDGVVLYEKA